MQLKSYKYKHRVKKYEPNGDADTVPSTHRSTTIAHHWNLTDVHPECVCKQRSYIFISLQWHSPSLLVTVQFCFFITTMQTKFPGRLSTSRPGRACNSMSNNTKGTLFAPLTYMSGHHSIEFSKPLRNWNIEPLRKHHTGTRRTRKLDTGRPKPESNSAPLHRAAFSMQMHTKMLC